MINQSHFITKECKTRDWKEPHGGRKSTRLWIQTNLGANPDLKQVTLPTLLNEQHWLEAQCWGHCWPCVGTTVAVALGVSYGFRYYKKRGCKRLQRASSERNRAPVGPLKSRQSPAVSECTGKVRASLLMKALTRSAPSTTWIKSKMPNHRPGSTFWRCQCGTKLCFRKPFTNSPNISSSPVTIPFPKTLCGEVPPFSMVSSHVGSPPLLPRANKNNFVQIQVSSRWSLAVGNQQGR